MKAKQIKSQLDELADWHATFPGKDATTVCLLWGESNRQLTELKQRLAAEKARADKLEADVTETARILQDRCRIVGQSPMEIVQALVGRANRDEEIAAIQQKQIERLIEGRNAEGILRFKAEAACAEMRAAAVCAHCGKPATCVGRYEGAGPVQFACDECCGHSNEDGWCKRLDDCGNGPAPAGIEMNDTAH